MKESGLSLLLSPLGHGLCPHLFFWEIRNDPGLPFNFFLASKSEVEDCHVPSRGRRKKRGQTCELTLHSDCKPNTASSSLQKGEKTCTNQDK